MIARRCTALLAGLFWLGRPAATHTARAPAAVDSLTTAYTVAGIRVIQQVNRANELVAVSLYLLGGTRQITDRTAGIEPLLLRAAANGTARYPDGLSQRAMARTGSVEFIDPRVDWTVVGFVTLRPEVDSAWQVFADRLMHPTLAADGVRLARDRMLATVRRRYTEPDERIQRIANQVAFVGHPYALDPEGTEQSLLRLRPQDLADYAATQMVKSRMLLVVVGNIDRPQIESLVTATIGNLPPGDYRWALPPLVPRQRESHWLIEPRDLPTNYILGYFTGPTAASDDYAAFRIATSLLSSRLYETIRVEKGLSYAAYAPFLERAVSVGGLYASTPKPELVLPMMYDQIRWLQRAEFDRFDLHQYVNSFVLDYLARSGTNLDRSDFLARAELYLGDYRLTDKYMSQLQRVAPEDVRKAIDRYMLSIQWAYLGDTTRMAGAW